MHSLPHFQTAFRFICLLALSMQASRADVKRVVVVKIDGLPGWYLDKALAETDPDTGKPIANAMSHIFAERGTRVPNFYARGLSLSVPSWQILDTGQHTQIHGNVEYDRYTLRVHDYLNFFPFVVGYSRGREADMPAVTVLDDLEIPLLSDRFGPGHSFQSFQLFQRGVRLITLKESLTKRFTTRGPQQLLDEWQAGFSMSQGVYEQLERELKEKLADPKVEYLDYFTGDFDHQAHLTRDAFTQRVAFERTDRIVGQVWNAIRASALADETVLAVVSDHGMNTSETVYSQSYSLVRFFTGAEGGSHHTITNRHPMQQFTLKGLDPFVIKVVNRSEGSPFGESYPSALLDLDGNERACVHLRNKHLHAIHLLLEKLPSDKTLAPRILAIIDSQREKWLQGLRAILNETSLLGRRIEVTPVPTRLKNKQFSQEERDLGLNLDARRKAAQLRFWQANRDEYEAYGRSLERLLSLDLATLEAGKFKIDEIIHPGAMGELNTFEELRSYPVEWTGSDFRMVDYPAALAGQRVRNVVQPEVGGSPIDVVAVREDAGSVQADAASVRLFGGDGYEVRIRQRSNGDLKYEPLGEWKAGLPLRLFEDPNLDIPAGEDRQNWLSQWHNERDWLRATHRTRYSNAVIGIAEQFGPVTGKRRQAVQADMLILANNHWNFNVRNFNPGGNHGSFFRVSTSSVLMFWGGDKTGIARGRVIEEPYDSLSFAPTILELMGRPHDDMPGMPIAGLVTRPSGTGVPATASPSRPAQVRTAPR